jgi:transposase-like protein
MVNNVLSYIRLTQKREKDMTKRQHTIIRYSNFFKEKVVQDISKGQSISAVRRRYAIGGMNTVQRWLKQYGRTELLTTVIRVQMKTEGDKLKQLEAENKRLKLAVTDAILAKDVLETLIEIVDEHYQTDVKKNFGQALYHDVRQQKIKT